MTAPAITRSARPTCACHDRPVADGATLCPDGADELIDWLEWMTSQVCRGDREPRRDDEGRILPGDFGRLPSSRWDTLSGQRRDLPSVLDDNAAKLARRDGHARMRTMRVDPPLPVDLRAVHRSGDLRDCVVSWLGELGSPVGLDSPWTTAQMAADLVAQVEAIRHREWAADMLADVRRTVSRAVGVVDAARVRVYLGPCDRVVPVQGIDGATTPCTGEVIGWSVPDPDERERQRYATARCTGCGFAFDVEARRQQLLDRARDMWLTAAAIENLTAALGRRVPKQTVDSWRDRGKVSCQRLPVRDDAGQITGHAWHMLVAEVLVQLEAAAQRVAKRNRRSA